MAKKCRLIEKEKAKIVVKYVNKKTKKFWKRLKKYGEDYVILKRKIIGAYSKTLLEDKLMMAQLVKLIKRSAKKVIENKENLDIYYQEFWIIAADLVKVKIINKKQYDKYFWKKLFQELFYVISVMTQPKQLSHYLFSFSFIFF